MSLHDWIELHGIGEVAKILNVPYRTVCSWKYRKSLPTAKNLKIIVSKSKGQLTYESIINGK